MRRKLTILAAVAAAAAVSAVPVLAAGPVDGQVCGDLVIVVNGEALVDESDCLPPEGDPSLPGLPGAPELPAPELPAPPALPGLPV